MLPASPLLETAHRPYPLPSCHWAMRQRWNDLLFAHWPIAPSQLLPHLPAGLELDTFAGEAWLGVVPFWMDQVAERLPHLPAIQIPTVSLFSELNLRTYVRSTISGRHGVFFFSLDCSSPLAVLGARTLFHLPYFFASIQRTSPADSLTIHYTSRRLLTHPAPSFNASFAPVGDVSYSQPGSLAAFLTERYCLFTSHRSHLLRGDIHHLPWPLQPAEAAIDVNQLPAAHALSPHDTSPLLHFSCSLEVYIWPLVRET